jgi:hypothetical protein
VECSQNGLTSVKLEEGAERLSTSITDENIEGVRDMILQNRRITTEGVTHQLEISHCAACEVTNDKRAFRKVRSR